MIPAACRSSRTRTPTRRWMLFSKSCACSDSCSIRLEIFAFFNPVLDFHPSGFEFAKQILGRDIPGRGQNPGCRYLPFENHLGRDAGGVTYGPVHGIQTGVEVPVIDELIGHPSMPAFLESPGGYPQDDDVAFIGGELEFRRQVSDQKLPGRDRPAVDRQWCVVQKPQLAHYRPETPMSGVPQRKAAHVPDFGPEAKKLDEVNGVPIGISLQRSKSRDLNGMAVLVFEDFLPGDGHFPSIFKDAGRSPIGF